MINLTVNGAPRQLDVAPEMPLLWALRETLALTGTKYGCGMALCGACTVHVDGTPIRISDIGYAEDSVKKVATSLFLADGSPGVALDVRRACHEHAMKFVGIQRAEFKRLGVFGDWERPYLTLAHSYEAAIARGEVFQDNPVTGDRRTSGTMASMAGLEDALAAGDDTLVDLAIRRILLGHALIASFGGIPLIYMGDEIALPNDYSYRSDPEHSHDSRWIHRPRMDWQRAAAAEEGMKATIPLVARKGRASYLGERSAGHQDPGATSSWLLLKTAADTWGG